MIEDGNRVESTDNLSQMVSDKADQFISKLSGGKVGHRQRVIDNLIVLMGAAGGTGTSTIVANLAYTISKKGLSVLVIDMNIKYPAQQIYMGIKQKAETKDLVSFLQGRNEIGESIQTVRHGGMVGLGGNDSGISVLLSNNRGLMDSINCDSEACSRNLSEAIGRIRPLFDVILVDCPMNIQMDVVNTMAYMADSIYSVWDEGVSCVSNIERLRRNMVASGIEAYNKMRVIFNKRTNIHYSQYPFDKLSIELVGTLPMELAVIESGLNGEIFCRSGASRGENASKFVEEMERIAGRVIEVGGMIE